MVGPALVKCVCCRRPRTQNKSLEIHVTRAKTEIRMSKDTNRLWGSSQKAMLACAEDSSTEMYLGKQTCVTSDNLRAEEEG